MFGKVFASLWQGSMVGKPDVQLVFVYMLANARADGTFNQTREVIAALTGLPVDRVRTAIDVLEGPDPSSRTEGEEGRRILRLDGHRDWGWSIVNYLKYRATRDEEDRKRQGREATARWRARDHGDPSVIGKHHGDPSVSHGEPKQKEKEKEMEKQESKTSARRASASSPGDLLGSSRTGDLGLTIGDSDEGTKSQGRGGVRVEAGDLDVARALPAIPLASGDEWRAGPGEVAEWRTAFPGVLLMAEFARMRVWCLANPKRRKTPRGVRAFVTRWLDEEQNRGQRQNGRPSSPAEAARSAGSRRYLQANAKGADGGRD